VINDSEHKSSVDSFREMASTYRKAPIKTTPLGQKTGVACRGCYAAELHDCSPSISREHYITEALLHYINRGGGLQVSGFPWMKSETMSLPPNALAAKVLCERHNTALSPLDDIAVRMFRSFDEKDAIGSGKHRFLFSGHDIERWLLKSMCGLAQARSLPTDKECSLRIPEHWLKILFGYVDFSMHRGLYLFNDIGYIFQGPLDLSLRAISRRGELSGLVISMCKYELILSMSGFPSRRFAGQSVVYRPLELYVRGPGYEKSIVLTWDGPADLGIISFTLDQGSK